MKYLTGFIFALCSHFSCMADEISFQKLVFDTVRNTGFNGVVLMSKNNKLVLQEYSGFADKNQQITLGAEHIFSPGSVGKEFTTVSIMQLVAQGKLNYQDNLNKYLDNLPQGAQDITIEHILTHTSGFPKIKWKKDITTADVIEQVKSAKLSFSPGKGYLYSNVNVLLRALVVERVTNDSFASFLQDNIFDVAQMKDSYQQTAIEHIHPNQVEGDYLTFIKGVTIYVTPADLLKFEQALWSGKLVQVNELTRFLEGDKLSGKKNRAYFDFGNFKVNENNKVVSWQHDGSNPSHHTLKYHDFVHNYILIIMSSDGNKSTLYAIRDAIDNMMQSTSKITQ